MKESEDNKFQEAAEKGTFIPGHQKEVDTYKSLFNALQKEDDSMPAFSPFFADKVFRKVEERSAKKEVYKEYFWKTFAIVIFISLGTIALTIFNTASQILQSLDSIKGYLLVGVVIMLLIDLADKKFVKKVI